MDLKLWHYSISEICFWAAAWTTMTPAVITNKNPNKKLAYIIHGESCPSPNPHQIFEKFETLQKSGNLMELSARVE